MKSIISLLSLFLITGMTAEISAQSFQQTMTRSARFSDSGDANNKFRLLNVHGSITLEAYDGDQIELTINEKIEGSDREIERGKKELEFVVEQDGNLIIAYLKAPFIEINREGDNIRYRIDREEDDYSFTHNIKARVPADILLDLSTINRGSVNVSGSFKKIKAANINGDLDFDKLTASESEVSTVNGDISITYATPPAADSQYNTVNGIIDIRFPRMLSADIYFKSLHGDLYTDFENIERLSPEVQKASQKSSKKISYRINGFNPVRIGDGGPKLNFEVLNGDVYLRKQ